MKNTRICILSTGVVMATSLLLLNFGDDFNNEESHIDICSVTFTVWRKCPISDCVVDC